MTSQPTIRTWRSVLAPLLALSATPFAAPVHSEQKPEDVAQVLTLGMLEEQRLSPDGHSVAFVRTGIAGAGGKIPKEIGIVPFDGKQPPRILTGEFGAATEPRWRLGTGPEQELAFLAESKPDEARPAAGKGLWLFDPARNALRRIPVAASGARRLEWVPGVHRVSFVRSVSCPEEANAPRVLGVPDPIDRLFVADVDGGVVEAVSPETLSIGRYAWSPDGRSVVAAATPADDPFSPERIVVFFRDGSPSRLLMIASGNTRALAWSPDASTVAWLGNADLPGSEPIKLVKVTGDPRPRAVLTDFDGSASWIGFRPDGRLVIGALRGLRLGIFSFRPDGSDLRAEYSPELFAPGSLCGEDLPSFVVSFSRDGSRLSATVSGPLEPGNVVAGPWRKPLRRITDLNPQVRQWPLGAYEAFRWKAQDGLELEGLLIKPPGWRPGTRYPTLVNLHGGPRRSWMAGWLYTKVRWGQFFASRGYLAFLPNPRGSEGYGAGFVRANEADLGGRDWDDVMSGVDALIGQGMADSGRLGVAGWSYGGYLAARGITRTDRFRMAIVGAGISNVISFEGTAEGYPAWSRDFWNDPLTPYRDPRALIESSPVHHATKVTTPTLMFHGEADYKVPPAQMIEFHTALRTLGVPTEAVLYPGGGHDLSDAAHIEDLYSRIDLWLKRYLPIGDDEGGARK